MAKKSAKPPANASQSSGSAPPQDSYSIQEWNKGVQQFELFPTDKLPLDGTDFGGITKEAVDRFAKGEDLSGVLGVLDNTTQSASVQAAKIITGGQRAYGVLDDVDEQIRKSKRDFIGLLGLGALIASLEAASNAFFGGIFKFLSSPSGNSLGNPPTDESPAYTRVKGRVIDAGIALGTRFSEKDYETIMGPNSTLQPYMFQVVENYADPMNFNIIYFSPKKTYPTPEGEKTGRQILEDFSGQDLEQYTTDPSKHRFNYIEAACGAPMELLIIDSDKTFNGYPLKKVTKQSMK